MHYIIYKTLNKANGRYYIGSHKTEKLDDGYLGSGKRLKAAIEKYGEENFEREVLYVFNNPDEMYAKEVELVTEEEVKNPDCYNLKEGGFGGWDYIANHPKRKEWLKRAGEKRGKELAKLNSVLNKERNKKGIQFGGKKHKEESKQKIRSSCSRAQSGSKNSQFGTIWITNGTESKKIRKDQEIPEGYRQGRKMPV